MENLQTYIIYSCVGSGKEEDSDEDWEDISEDWEDLSEDDQGKNFQPFSKQYSRLLSTPNLHPLVIPHAPRHPGKNTEK